MELISMKENLENKKLEKVAFALKEGKVAIFPTETVYGIGTNATLEKAVERVFSVKERDKSKALIVLVSSYQMATTIAEISNQIEKDLINRFWPGPLTLILKKKDIIPSVVTGGKDTIAICECDNELVKKLIEISNVPLVASSANLSGLGTTTSIETIKRDLGSKVDYIIDQGDILENTPTTVVQVINDKIVVLREGKISLNQLSSVAPISNKI